MNILLHDSFYNPLSLTEQLRKSLLTLGHHVLRIGPSNRLQIHGSSEFLDISAAVTGSPEKWELLIFIDNSGNPYFPIGLEKLPFPTVMLSSDYLVKPSDTMNATLFPLFDCVIAHSTHPMLSIRRFNPHVFFVPIGVFDDVFEIKSERIYDVGQVGALNHPYRIRIARELQRRYHVNDIDRFYPHAEVREVYSRSKISVNAANDELILLNMRMFEIMACGALLITGPVDPAFDEMFQEGVHFVRYKTDPDLFDKIDYYLAHDEERERIARAGQAEVLARHRFEHRVRDIMQIVSNLDPPLAAPARGQSIERVAGYYMRAYMRRSEADAVYRTAMHYLPRRARWGALPYWAGALARQLLVLTGFAKPFTLP
jgi:hypothetical protein